MGVQAASMMIAIGFALMIATTIALVIDSAFRAVQHNKEQEESEGVD